MTRIYPKLFLGMAVVILAGYVNLPFWRRLIELLRDSQAPGDVRLVQILAHVGPFIPLIAALACIAPYRFSEITAKSIAAVVFGCGVIFSLFAGALSGAGAEIAWLYGLTLTMAVAASVLLLADSQAKPWWPFLGFGLLLVPLAAAIWSLTAGLIIYRQAERLSARQPFCIAHHSGRDDPVTSFAALRGFMFDTIRSGYKDSSVWYFHGLLLVGRGQHLAIYNWSPRHLRFDRLEKPEIQLINPSGACWPQKDFWHTLSLT